MCRLDMLHPALLQPGQLDRKVEFGLPDLESWTQILKIHTRTMNCEWGICFELLSFMSQFHKFGSLCFGLLQAVWKHELNEIWWQDGDPILISSCLLLLRTFSSVCHWIIWNWDYNHDHTTVTESLAETCMFFSALVRCL
jgi:SpoVK/Ycf46/Vps4 family AAA+-type ATPase